MFGFRKIWCSLFSWNTRFEIRPFVLLPRFYLIGNKSKSWSIQIFEKHYTQLTFKKVNKRYSAGLLKGYQKIEFPSKNYMGLNYHHQHHHYQNPTRFWLWMSLLNLEVIIWFFCLSHFPKMDEYTEVLTDAWRKVCIFQTKVYSRFIWRCNFWKSLKTKQKHDSIFKLTSRR